MTKLEHLCTILLTSLQADKLTTSELASNLREAPDASSDEAKALLELLRATLSKASSVYQMQPVSGWRTGPMTDAMRAKLKTLGQNMSNLDASKVEQYKRVVEASAKLDMSFDKLNLWQSALAEHAKKTEE